MFRNALSLIFVAVISGSLPCTAMAQEPAPAPSPAVATPEAELLRAELLEISKGDLAAAADIYARLLSDAATPEPARARALLYHARLKRKTGDLAGARALLEEFVAKHAHHAELLATARSYLSELTQGAAANPAFDWLTDLSSRPEIQAKIFELCVELADPESDAGVKAIGQLQALGSLANPMVEQLLKTSSNAAQKVFLALHLVENGKPEFLPAFFAGEFARYKDIYRRMIPLIREVERSPLRFRDAVARLSVVHELETPYAAILRLHVGIEERLDADVLCLGHFPTDLTRSLLAKDSIAHAAVKMLAGPGLSDDAYSRALEAIVVCRLELVRPEMFERAFVPSTSLMEKLVNLRMADEIVAVMSRLYASGKRYGGVDFGPLPVTDRARVYRAAGEGTVLWELAREDDQAIPMFVEFLLAVEQGLEYYLKAPRTETGRRVKPSQPQPRRAGTSFFAPSLAYVNAMAFVLRNSPNDGMRRIALDELAWAPDGVGVDLVAELRAIFESIKIESEEFQAAMRMVVKRVASWKARSRDYLDLCVDIVGKDAQQATIRPRFDSFSSALGSLDESDRSDFIREWLRQADVPELLLLVHQRVVQYVLPNEVEASIDKWQSPTARKFAFELLTIFVDSNMRRGELVQSASVVRYAATLISDRELSAERRVWMAARIRAHHFEPSQYRHILDALLLAVSTDPALMREFVKVGLGPNTPVGFLEPGDRERFIADALLSSEDAARAWAILNHSNTPALSGNLKTALHQAADFPVAAGAAIGRVLGLDSADAIALLHQALSVAHGEDRQSVIKRLSYFASFDSLEPLAALLDNNDYGVRKDALAALESIRDTLAKQDAWREAMKKLPPPAAKKPE
ncbi:MAG: tetratricopeptide repeat protein [Planctomycetota bacterium]